MVKRLIDELLPGMLLAKPVLEERSGSVLLEQGLELTSENIKSLEQRGIMEVYVSEAELDELEDKSRRAGFTEKVKKLSVQARTCAFASVKDTIEGLDEEDSSNSLEMEKCMDQILDVLDLDKNQLVKISLTQPQEEYIFNHAVNVSVLALVIAGYLELDEPLKRVVGEAALLHDMGLIKMDPGFWDHVEGFDNFTKPVIQEHISHGEEVLSKISGIRDETLAVVRTHHERLDGGGLPGGLSGGELDEVSNIVVVADMYESLTRPYDQEKALTGQQALKTLFAAMEKYEQRILKSFLGDLAMFPIGSIVQLSSGAIALVVAAVKDQPFRPRVKVITDNNGVKLAEPYEMDLSLKRNFLVFIEKTLKASEVKVPFDWD